MAEEEAAFHGAGGVVAEGVQVSRIAERMAGVGEQLHAVAHFRLAPDLGDFLRDAVHADVRYRGVANGDQGQRIAALNGTDGGFGGAVFGGEVHEALA